MATTEIYTLSLHDALPILAGEERARQQLHEREIQRAQRSSTHAGFARQLRRIERAGSGIISAEVRGDRKSTRLNSSHGYISYAVFCLKKKKKKQDRQHRFV